VPSAGYLPDSARHLAHTRRDSGRTAKPITSCTGFYLYCANSAPSDQLQSSPPRVAHYAVLRRLRGSVLAIVTARPPCATLRTGLLMRQGAEGPPAEFAGNSQEESSCAVRMPQIPCPKGGDSHREADAGSSFSMPAGTTRWASTGLGRARRVVRTPGPTIAPILWTERSIASAVSRPARGLRGRTTRDRAAAAGFGIRAGSSR
jgi:hypothetical protein